MNTIPISLIVALDSKNGISINNKIPWQIKEDSNFFQDTTKRSFNNKQNAVIFGKNTWKALPDSVRGLKDRINIIVSTTMTITELNQDNCTQVYAYLKNNLIEAIEFCKTLDIGRIFICGGNKIYMEALELNISELYITRIHKDYKCDNILEIDQFLGQYNLYKSHRFLDIEFFKYYNKNINVPDHFICNEEEKQYQNLLEYTLKNGHFRQTRNSKTWSIFGKHLEFNLDHFPILTTKKLFLKGVFEELLFFLKGDTNANHLSEKSVKIWDPNTSTEFLKLNGLNYEQGDMGPMYGFQFCHNGAEYLGMNENYSNKGFNQIEYCLNLLKNDPFSRRIIMTSFSPYQAKEGVLYPCHGIAIQFYVESNSINNSSLLSCSMYQRSADLACGIPFNIASYAFLVYMLCEIVNNDINSKIKLVPGRLIMSLGDCHIYEDHYTNVIKQILRDPYPFPKLNIKRKVTELTDFKFDDFELINYNSYPNILYKMVA